MLQNVVVISSRRGGSSEKVSHKEWLESVDMEPDVISMFLLPLTSLLKRILGGGYVSHAINLYLRCKHSIIICFGAYTCDNLLLKLMTLELKQVSLPLKTCIKFLSFTFQDTGLLRLKTRALALVGSTNSITGSDLVSLALSFTLTLLQ